MSVETLIHSERSFAPTIHHASTEIETSGDALHVFDVSLYKNLFNQATQAGLSPEQARSVVTFAATYDSLGAITENISGEKDDFGNYVFDVEDRIRMQLTPHKHYYLQEEDEMTQEPMMVAPEHKWGNFKKDVLSLISNWRRSMDKVGMAGVRAKFLDKSQDSLKEGETIVWGSPKAEEWEEVAVRKYNGQYGFLYVGKVVNINGTKVLEVHDFKNDLDASAYDIFFHSIEGEVCIHPLYSERPLVDKVKASYVRTNQHLTRETVWRKLGGIQKQIRGKDEIFDLPVDAIIALQDSELQKRIQCEVAAPIGTWIAAEIYRGTSTDEVQNQVRQKFIDMTLVLVNKIKAEKSSRMRLVREQSLIDISTLPVIDSQRYIDRVDPAVLQRYSGSGGIGCGSWGRSGSGRGGIRIGNSVAGLTSAFGGSESIGGICRCGRSKSDGHYHCPDCDLDYDNETDVAPENRTKSCGCGFAFGCGGSAEKEEEPEEALPKAA